MSLNKSSAALFTVCLSLFIWFQWGLLKSIVIRYSYSTIPLEDCPDCNVIVIVVDTLRADHLPFYGYSRDTAPFLATLANKSALFERTFSASSWTAPSTASIFMGMLPSSHGVITGFAATKDLQRDNPSIEINQLPMHAVTLSEYMKQAGYRTIGVTDNINIGFDMGFNRGFDRFSNTRSLGADQVNSTAKRFLDEVSNKPYFLYLHYMDPHTPYKKNEPWFSECVKDPKLSKRDRLVCAYDSEIALVDAKIRELFTRYHWMENSIVFFTADHGEEFWDHDKLGHGKTLYTELIHVPFLIYHPNREARSVKYNVQSFDILPTLARMLYQQKDDTWEGKSLRRLLKGLDPRDLHRPVVSERLRHIERDAPVKRSIVVDDWHYIVTTAAQKNEKILKEELYDISSDPGEKKNMIPKHLEISRVLSQNLSNFTGVITDSPDEDKASVVIDENTLTELKSLGYF